jgi:hypothetical protein
MTEKRALERQEKLKCLLKFYNKYKYKPFLMSSNCPFAFSSSDTYKFIDLSCMQLCYQFNLLITDEEYSACPCGWYGQKKALERLKLTLLANNMLKEED